MPFVPSEIPSPPLFAKQLLLSLGRGQPSLVGQVSCFARERLGNINRKREKGLLQSEWVNIGESCPERLAGEEVGGFFDRGKSGQAFLRLRKATISW